MPDQELKILQKFEPLDFAFTLYDVIKINLKLNHYYILHITRSISFLADEKYYLLFIKTN